jgi:hypothetical protein
MTRTDEDVIVVFAEPARDILKDNPKLLAVPDKSALPPEELLEHFSVTAEKRGPYAALIEPLTRGDKDAILDKLVENGVALKLKELVTYFNKSGFNVDSIDLNVAGKLGINFYVVSAEANTGITITITPKNSQMLKKAPVLGAGASESE